MENHPYANICIINKYKINKLELMVSMNLSEKINRCLIKSFRLLKMDASLSFSLSSIFCMPFLDFFISLLYTEGFFRV